MLSVSPARVASQLRSIRSRNGISWVGPFYFSPHLSAPAGSAQPARGSRSHRSGTIVTGARYLRRNLKYLSSDELAQPAEASTIMSQITAASSNTAQIEYWNSSAGETWAQFQEPLDRQIEPLGLAAIAFRQLDAQTDDLGHKLFDAVLKPREGQHIIDIGCGCGQTTLSLASRVGVAGSVMGVDISKPMLEVALRRPRPAPNLPVIVVGTSGE